MTAKKTDPDAALTEAPKVKVRFARAWTIDDRQFEPDQEVELSAGDADEVLRYGYARRA